MIWTFSLRPSQGIDNILDDLTSFLNRWEAMRIEHMFLANPKESVTADTK
jgi:hypothetical protein